MVNPCRTRKRKNFLIAGCWKPFFRILNFILNSWQQLSFPYPPIVSCPFTYLCCSSYRRTSLSLSVACSFYSSSLPSCVHWIAPASEKKKHMMNTILGSITSSLVRYAAIIPEKAKANPKPTNLMDCISCWPHLESLRPC